MVNFKVQVRDRLISKIDRVCFRELSRIKNVFSISVYLPSSSLRVDSHLFFEKSREVLPKTQKQSSILRVLSDLGGPVTPQELLSEASKELPGLGLATVYRALKTLVETGKARKIELAGAPPHYEMRGDSHHHFFVCEVCQKVFDLEGCPGGFKKMLPPGFQMSSHEIVIYGICSECSA